MSLTAGIGWFAVNSVSGAFALNTLTHMPKLLALGIVVVAQILVAFFGHNLVQVFERFAFPFLAVVFLIATVDVFTKAHLGVHGSGGIPTFGCIPGRGRRCLRVCRRLEPLRVGLLALHEAGREQ